MGCNGQKRLHALPAQHAALHDLLFVASSTLNHLREV